MPTVEEARRTHGHEDDAAPKVNRRRFLQDTAKKAAYIAPVVWVLSAREARAGGSCAPAGNLCGSDSDCCSVSCSIGLCD